MIERLQRSSLKRGHRFLEVAHSVLPNERVTYAKIQTCRLQWLECSRNEVDAA